MEQKKFNDNSLIELLKTIKDTYDVEIKEAGFKLEQDLPNYSANKVVTIKFIPVS
ncbi:MAG: hypothetical protein PHP92_03490 [Candidatus Nanoarchaeia archaeon]|nr:hypothetical protein [Candidatus Nanoarchaeia archaeon]